MNPVLPCPYCNKDYDFHDDDVPRVADGSAVCLRCGLEMAEAAFILEAVAGQHPHLIEDDEEGGVSDSDDE